MKQQQNEESCAMRSFIICTHPQISLGRLSQENEVSGACVTFRRGGKSVQGFGGKARRKENTRKTEE
jgi:hypothetical protein